MRRSQPASSRRAMGGRGERGFTIIEATVALFVTAEIIIAGLALFDFNNKLARVETQISDMQQSIRVADYDMVRMIRMAGRGGLPAILQSNKWGAVTVRNNVGVGGVSDQLAIAFASTPVAVDGTDILTVRGVFGGTMYQVQPSGTLTLKPPGATPATATGGNIVVCAYGTTGLAQDLTPLIALINSEKAAGQTDALILNNPLSDSLYAVVELDPSNSVVTGNQASCSIPLWVTSPPAINGISVAFKVGTADSLSTAFQTLSATSSTTGLPANMSTVSGLGVLEEYRYYIRSDFVNPADPKSDPAPHLSRARMYPGTELPYQNDATNLQADIADSVLDLQVALGADSATPPGTAVAYDGVITENNPPDKTDEWLGNAVGDTLTPVNSPHLLELRFTLLVKTENRDPSYQATTTIANIEDNVYTATTFPNTPVGRAYRSRQIQTVVAFRNL